MVGLSHAVSESFQAEVCLSTLGATWYFVNHSPLHFSWNIEICRLICTKTTQTGPVRDGGQRCPSDLKHVLLLGTGGKAKFSPGWGPLPLTCLEFASSRFRSHREAALRSQLGRWCWHPEAAVHAERGTGQGSVWPALRSGGVHAGAGAGWPTRT